MATDGAELSLEITKSELDPPSSVSNLRLYGWSEVRSLADIALSQTDAFRDGITWYILELVQHDQHVSAP